LWATDPTLTSSWAGLTASRFWVGSSKQWSQSVTWPDRSSWVFSHEVTRSSGRFPPAIVSKINSAGPGTGGWAGGASATTIVCPDAAWVKK